MVSLPVDHNIPKRTFMPMQGIVFPNTEKKTDETIIGNSGDTGSNMSRASGKTPTGQRKRKRWTDQEVDFLLEGVRLFGVGSWKDILNHFQFGDRSYVDLKDKFRNLLKHYSADELLGKTTNSSFSSLPPRQ